jgi:hypothetical protein
LMKDEFGLYADHRKRAWIEDVVAELTEQAPSLIPL